MKVATILFTYHRYKHTKAVLDGLRENYILPKKLFIFQDGMKASTNEEEWVKVNNLIKEVSFCSTEVIVSTKNKGLAQSVIDGVNHVFEDYDAIIVLEDDCVPSPNFINFMMQCLDKYRDKLRVHSVSGWAWPFINQQDSEIYFTGRSSSWGWGTWKDRWRQLEIHPSILHRIMEQAELSTWMSMWGQDLLQMLMANVRGENDSWAVYWALNAIENEMLCVAPCVSLINNIGFDGTGVHCGNIPDFETLVESRKRCCYHFPQNITINNNVQSAFIKQYGSCVVNQQDESLEHAVIYGIGRFYSRFEKDLVKLFYIEAFIDRAFAGFYAGRPILSVEMLGADFDKKVIIMLSDPLECEKVKTHLILKCRIKESNIVYGIDLINSNSSL